MTFDEALEADVAVLMAVQQEQEAIAELVRDAGFELDGHTDEWVPTGLDPEKLGLLADQILKRRRLTVDSRVTTTKTGPVIAGV